MTDGPRKLLSIIVPARNEESNLPRVYAEVSEVMRGVPVDYEVLVIDNASTDRTEQAAALLCARDSRWRYLRFSRNFHVEISLTAGLRHANGDAALILFSDLQDPPDLIPEFVKRWQEGHDVVYGVVRRRTGDPAWKALGAKLLYRLINNLADVNIPPDATDFRLLSRRAIDALNQFDERNRYLRGLSHWVGFSPCPLPYDRRPRLEGQSKAPLWYLLGLAANALTCFSIRPLQLFTLAGLGSLAVLLLLSFAWVVALAVGLPAPGLAAVYLLLLANLTAMLLGFGTIGEYLGRTYIESKSRPLYVIERTINLDAIPVPQPRAA